MTDSHKARPERAVGDRSVLAGSSTILLPISFSGTCYMPGNVVGARATGGEPTIIFRTHQGATGLAAYCTTVVSTRNSADTEEGYL